MSFIASTLSFNIPGAPAAPPTCTASDAAVIQSDGSMFSRIALNYVKEIKGNSQTFVNGTCTEVFQGTKRAFVYGHYMETYWSTKHQQIFINETKLNVAVMEQSCIGAKTEVVRGVSLQGEFAGKLHVASGQNLGIITTGKKFKAALKKKRHSRLMQTVSAVEQRTAASAEWKIKNWTRSVQHMKYRVGQMTENGDTYESTLEQTKKKASSYKCTTDGTEGRKAAKIQYVASGDASVTGSGSAELKGGGCSVTLGSKLAVDGTDVVVDK